MSQNTAPPTPHPRGSPNYLAHPGGCRCASPSRWLGSPTFIITPLSVSGAPLMTPPRTAGIAPQKPVTELGRVPPTSGSPPRLPALASSRVRLAFVPLPTGKRGPPPGTGVTLSAAWRWESETPQRWADFRSGRQRGFGTRREDEKRDTFMIPGDKATGGHQHLSRGARDESGSRGSGPSRAAG